MEWNWVFFLNNVLLGVGLAMDAFSVSLANGLNEPTMRKNKVLRIAGVYALFQALMPMIGWVCVHTVLQYFKSFENFIPWIALLLLGFLGGKMLLGAIHHKDGDEEKPAVSFSMLIVQGNATSIDALSVGFTISDYKLPMAIISALIIAVVTFIICVIGIYIGKRFGTKLSNKAELLGGIILIGIGIEIFINGIL